MPGSICCCLRVICKSVLMSVFETFYYYIVFAEYSSICSINTSPLAYITYRLYSNTLIIHFSENHENSMRGRSQHFEGDTRPLRLDINCVLHCKNKIIVRYTIYNIWLVSRGQLFSKLFPKNHSDHIIGNHTVCLLAAYMKRDIFARSALQSEGPFTVTVRPNSVLVRISSSAACERF